MRGHGKGESRAHAARIALDRCVDEALHARELDDGFELGVDLPLLHAHDGTVEIDVLAPGELLVESGTDFQQRGDPSPSSDTACSRIGDPGEYFQQRALAGTVTT